VYNKCDWYKEVHNNTKIAVLVVKYFTYLKHTALDRLQVRLNVILLTSIFNYNEFFKKN